MIRKLTKLQDNFAILDALKISDDVLICNLQEEFPLNECDQAIIQVFPCKLSCLNNSGLTANKSLILLDLNRKISGHSNLLKLVQVRPYYSLLPAGHWI